MKRLGLSLCSKKVQVSEIRHGKTLLKQVFERWESVSRFTMLMILCGILEGSGDEFNLGAWAFRKGNKIQTCRVTEGRKSFKGNEIIRQMDKRNNQAESCRGADTTTRYIKRTDCPSGICQMSSVAPSTRRRGTRRIRRRRKDL